MTAYTNVVRILFAYLIILDDVSPLFAAYKSDGESLSGFPRFPEQTQNEFHINGLHAEIIGRAAEHRQECGVILLDYTAFISGAVFDAIMEPHETAMKKSNVTSLNATLREEVYNTLKEEELKLHINDIQAIFGKYYNISPVYSTEQLRFFPIVGAIAVGLGIGLGKLIYDGISSLIRKINEHDSVNRVMAREIAKLGKQVKNLGNLIELHTYQTRFGFVLTQVRMQLLASVETALSELFNYGRVSDKLISHQGENGLLAAIADLMGVGRFNTTLLQRYYSVAGAVVSTSVLSMSKRVIEMKVCYPITKEKELGYMVEVVPLGEFNRNRTEFVWHKLKSHYILPQTMRLENVCSLPEIQDVDEGCVRIASIHLCRVQAQMDGCGLSRENRRTCAVERRNSSSEEFTLIKPLLRTAVVATRYSSMLYRKGPNGDSLENVRIEKPVFVVEVPRGATLHIGTEIIKARIAASKMVMDLKVIVPIINDTLGPVVMPDDNTYDRPSSSFWTDEGMGMSWQLVCTMVTILNAVFLVLIVIAYRHFRREIRKLKRWRVRVDACLTHDKPLSAYKLGV